MINRTTLLAGLLVAGGALAAPPENADPAMSPWFQSLQTDGGLSCCGAADCRGTKDFPVRVSPEGYEVRVLGEWMPVPAAAVSTRTDNPTGDFVTCVQTEHWLAGVRAPQVLCLIKAPRT